MTETSLHTAAALVADTMVWDNHACMPLRPADHSFLDELGRIKTAGVDVISLNIGFGPQGPDEHLAMLDSFTAWLSARPDEYLIVHSAADAMTARATGRLGVLFDVEGMYPLNGNRIDLVSAFRKRGVGWMLIAYNRNNDAGGGCTDDDPGLSAYGREVLAEMRRVGMIICCSHTGHRTAMDVLEHADSPVIFSHSNPSAVFPHYRNIPDSLIRACAETGGVVGINGLSTFLGNNDASPFRVAEHIDYVTQLVGPRHVAIGLDYVFDKAELFAFLTQMRDTFPDDESLRQPLQMLHPERIVEIVACLIDRGYRSDDIAMIVGGNWLRVAGEVWN